MDVKIAPEINDELEFIVKSALKDEVELDSATIHQGYISIVVKDGRSVSIDLHDLHVIGIKWY